jgi:HK97 family phage major capsid protein
VADLVDKEEEMLLTGDGVPPNPRGVLATTGLTAARPKAEGESIADAILQAALGVQAASRMALDGVVFGPLTYGALVSERAETAGTYLSGPPNSMTPSLSLWGLRVVVSSAMTEGTALVGAFRRGGMLFRKGGVRIEAPNSHSDFFTKNLTAIRCESRIVLAIRRPAAFGTATELVAAAP